MLRRLRSFGVCRTLLKSFYVTVVASAIFFAIVSWRAESTERDRNSLNKLVKRDSFVLVYLLDRLELLKERRMLVKLTSIMGLSPPV